MNAQLIYPLTVKIIYGAILILFIISTVLLVKSLFIKDLKKIAKYLFSSLCLGVYFILIVISHDIYYGNERLQWTATATQAININEVKNMKAFEANFYRKNLVDGHYGFVAPELEFTIQEKSNDTILVVYSHGYDLDDDGGDFIEPNFWDILIPFPFKDGDVLILKQRIASK